MMKAIFFIVIVAGICYLIHSLDFMKKLAAKIVLVYLMLGWLALCIWTVAFSVQEVYGGGYDRTMEERLRQVERNLSNGRIDEAMTEMYYDKSYEEEFDYAWERGTMYQLYNRYQLFSRAAGTDPMYAREAEDYRQRLLQICESSDCSENALYVEFYRRELEKE